MNLAKSVFVVFVVIYNVLGFIHGILLAGITGKLTMAWAAAITSNALMSGYFLIYLLGIQPARTSKRLPFLLLTTTGCAIMVVADSILHGAEFGPLLYGVLIGLCGSYLYVFWYSDLERPQSVVLEVGKQLTNFQLETYDGKRYKSMDFIGRPALFLFYRGNWCPLCLSQIIEIGENFLAFAERGVTLILVSPQPKEETQQLAVTNPHGMYFMIDHGCKAARQLNIFHERGLPFGLEVAGYDPDTVYPTIVITDADGVIVYTHQPDNYRTRPTVEHLIQVLDDVGITVEAAEELMPLFHPVS